MKTKIQIEVDRLIERAKFRALRRREDEEEAVRMAVRDAIARGADKPMTDAIRLNIRRAFRLSAE